MPHPGQTRVGLFVCREWRARSNYDAGVSSTLRPIVNLRPGRPWGLAQARVAAAELLLLPRPRVAVQQLLRALAAHDPELRVHAADVLRRGTEKDAAPLLPHASAILAVLPEVPLEEKRARWHLGLVAARIARTPPQVRMAAELLWQMSEDTSNVVRCSAIEGLGLLALRDPTLRGSVEELLHQARTHGTAAMQCRARSAIKRLERSTLTRRPG